MLKQKKKYEIDMCEGPILKKMLIFTIPLIFSGMLQLLFNAADIIVVGNFAGDNSLAAVGSTSSLVNLLVNLFVGLSIGANVLIARYYGAKQQKELDDTVHTAIALAIIGGVVLTIIGVIFAPTFLRWMQTPDNIIDLASIYLRVYFIGMIPMLLYNYGAAMLRAVGDTQRPMKYLIIAGCINVVFNLLFVIAFKWDVFGVALATTISQTVSAVLVIRCLMKGEGSVRLDLKKIRLDSHKLLRILEIGIPTGIQGMLFSISNVIIQSSINSFGDTVVAGSSAAANIEGFVYTAMNSFYQANISFTSQNVGAGKKERINKILYTALACVTVVGVGMGVGAYLIGPTLLSFYTNSDAVIAAGMIRFKYVMLPYVLCGIMEVLVGSIRGMGYVIAPMFVSLIGACALRLVFIATLFQTEQFHTLDMLYATYPVSWVVTISAHVVTFIIVRAKMNKKM